MNIVPSLRRRGVHGSTSWRHNGYRRCTLYSV